ncbi:MAG: DNA cytosine methyltransferase, partial [Chloroflexi bacterium]|nr:DNA cytosine methyltransferase [Chloroflexota bacterium]
EQRQLLLKAQRTGEPLAEVLSSAGWCYDDLIYDKSGVKHWEGGRPPPLAEYWSGRPDLPLVSFFTGCGGMDLGLEAAGYRHLAGFEINELFCKTLRRNRPDWAIFGPPTHSGDVSRFDDVASALERIIQIPFEGLFAGGPPCQPFSIASNQRFPKGDDNFKRTGFLHEANGNLLFDFLRLIIAFRPRAFLIENVPGLRDLDGGVQLAAAMKELRGNGFNVSEPLILDAAQYRVPQTRTRLFVIGSRNHRAFVPPKPSPQVIGAGSVLADIGPGLKNMETRDHKAESILRYMRLDYGQRDQLGRVNRLDPTSPSNTVIAGGTNGGGRSHLHPEIPRTLSVRECARLQTFPDDFEFMGPSGRQFTQAGNAVPPLLAAQVGRSIRESFF